MGVIKRVVARLDERLSHCTVGTRVAVALGGFALALTLATLAARALFGAPSTTLDVDRPDTAARVQVRDAGEGDEVEAGPVAQAAFPGTPSEAAEKGYPRDDRQVGQVDELDLASSGLSQTLRGARIVWEVPATVDAERMRQAALRFVEGVAEGVGLEGDEVELRAVWYLSEDGHEPPRWIVRLESDMPGSPSCAVAMVKDSAAPAGITYLNEAQWESLERGADIEVADRWEATSW